MYENTLVPVVFDAEHHTAESIEMARYLTREKGNLTLLHVVETLPAYATQYLPEGYLAKAKVELADKLETMAEEAKAQARVVSGHPGPSILEYAERNGVDCIVIASHMPGLQDYFVSGTAAHLVRHAPCAVHVMR
ncbi:MAG: universal stress protein [Pseudomonadota bacterium]